MFKRQTSREQQSKYDRIHVVSSPAHSLADMIANPPEGSVKTQITPALAQSMLDYNTRNRPVRPTKVLFYARQMTEGKWHYTRVPIIFSDQGRVIDGQHRLMAIVESGKTITADVAFGAPDDAFAFIDVGAQRGAADIFAINGVKNSKAMAAITQVVFKYDQGRRTIGTGGVGGAYALSHADLYEIYLSLPHVDDSFAVVTRFASSRLAPPTLMAALHYICARKCRRDADEFFTIVSDGGGSANGAPRELHKRLIRNATSVDKMSRDYLAGLTLEAWNRHRRGLTGRGLKFDGGKLPAVM